MVVLLPFGYLNNSNNQGIIGCTPTNVPLLEIPIGNPYSSWVFMGNP